MTHIPRPPLGWPLAAALILPLLFAVAYDAEKRALGNWELAAIDGVGPAAAAPIRALFPAGAYGADTVAENGMWHEYTVESFLLTFEPESSFRERVVESRRTLVRQSTFERPEYVSGAFGGDLIRDEASPEALAGGGTWTLAGDSLVLTRAPAQIAAATLARLRQALPDAPEAAVREAVARASATAASARWSGEVKGDRLELRDADGRRYAFRRSDSGG